MSFIVDGRERAYAAKDWCILPDKKMQVAERLSNEDINEK